MTVLKGEGTHNILYGSTGFSSRTRILPGYLARPDAVGSPPAVVLVPPEGGVTSSLKDLARRLARRGLAVAAPDLYRGSGPGRRATEDEIAAAFAKLTDRSVLADLDATVEFLRGPGTEWAHPQRIGMMALGGSGRWAVHSALENPEVRSLALAYAPLAASLDLVGRLDVPVLGLYGRDDERAPASDATAARSRLPGSEWVIYQGVDHGFLDDAGPTYDLAAAQDSIDRIAKFFDRTLALESSPA